MVALCCGGVISDVVIALDCDCQARATVEVEAREILGAGDADVPLSVGGGERGAGRVRCRGFLTA
jgi:hypothetical protein